MTADSIAFFYSAEVAAICNRIGTPVAEFIEMDHYDLLELIADHLIVRWETTKEEGSDDEIEDAAARLRDFLAVHKPGKGQMVPWSYEIVYLDHLGELATMEVCGLD
jgi:hypothetical protein